MKRLHDYNRYSKIFVDETGLGGGIIDFLEDEEDWFKNVVEGITFSPDKKTLLYTNLLKLAEDRQILLPENHKYTPETIRQWSAIERDTTKSGKSRATSKIGKDDFVDALALLAWGARKTAGTIYFRGG
jgi:phage FluMu gp28-like protein